MRVAHGRLAALLGALCLIGGTMIAGATPALAAPGGNGNGVGPQKVASNGNGQAVGLQRAASTSTPTSPAAPVLSAPTVVHTTAPAVPQVHTVPTDSVGKCLNGGHSGPACKNPVSTGCNANNPHAGGCPASGSTGPVCGNGLHVGNPHCVVKVHTPPPVGIPGPVGQPGGPPSVGPPGVGPSSGPAGIPTGRPAIVTSFTTAASAARMVAVVERPVIGLAPAAPTGLQSGLQSGLGSLAKTGAHGLGLLLELSALLMLVGLWAVRASGLPWSDDFPLGQPLLTSSIWPWKAVVGTSFSRFGRRRRR